MKSLNVAPIVNNFYRDILNDPKRSDWEAYILVLVPAIVAQISVVRHIDAQFVSTMSTTLAILFGFTFTSLMSTAKYTAKDDPLEEKIVRETRIVTAYALLVNLVALIGIVVFSVIVVDFSTQSYIAATSMSAALYFVMFHYLLVMVHLMRYLYLLSIGGAFEERDQGANESNTESQDPPSDMKITTK